MAKQNKNPLSIEFNDEFIDAVAERVIEKTSAVKKEVEPESNELEFYTVKQVVSITQKSNLTIRNHIHAGLLEAKKVGKSFLIKKEHLQTYLNN